ncbi:hypothetical protein MUO69_02475 [Candidatus Bathyarchaeota archaeon]|nr:hypothetical protein [Candidatus Bathyarchaeota archaeon]
MSRTLGLTVAFVVVLFGVLSVNAAQRTVGVKAGDWAEYAFTLSGNATVAYTGTMKLGVKEVASTTITYNISYTPGLPPGAFVVGLDPKDYTCDAATGEGSSGLFIAANLNTGDTLYTSMNASMNGPLSATSSREYVGQTIEVNHWFYLMGSPSIDLFWVRATGMLTELHIAVVIDTTSNTTIIEDATLTATSVIPEFPSTITFPLLLLLLTLAMTIVSRKHSRMP